MIAERTAMRSKLILPLLMVLGAGCADSYSSVEIDGRASPSDAQACTYAAGGLKLLGPGVLDIAAGNPLSYGMVVYLKNNAADPSVLGTGATPSGKAWRADAARVRVNPQNYIDRYGPNPRLLAYAREAVVPLDGQTTPAGGSSVQAIEAIPRALGQDVAAAAGSLGANVVEVVLGITLMGATLDGQRLDTNEWYFPLKLCQGCLAGPTTCPSGKTLTTGCGGLGQDQPAFCK